jgi:Fe-S-cluster containining protein
MTDWEAKRIAKYSKREMTPAGQEMHPAQIMDMQKKYVAVPCPFLINKECSVYPVRPMVCRLHFSVANDADACDILAHPGAQVPYLNLEVHKSAYGFIFAENGCTFADIREFFP